MFICNCLFYLHTETPKCTVMECLKRQVTLVWKDETNWTKKGWPIAWSKTSFSTLDTRWRGTILRANFSSPDLSPHFDFFLASMTLPNDPLPRCSIISKSLRHKLSSSLRRTITQTLENIYQNPAFIPLTVLLKKRTLYNVRTYVFKL